ncbi:hypothetical protein KIPB_005511 [Kipferlia bialata]|uniref:Uncharacterized protein n=1 Tax=Kipferlia bialata TaxID=797122 RepID=A0A9K3GG56_9EUKA|nr:hypothetical protein KIPB_002076 [Kipferlia bialata]GIQ81658.1 hypothetical protein KIPB_002649 [Kipferlia bialata]GIQ81826.1 hypothetical protein KIPB_002850 [Kipferlia bialata]GIQ82502.1 hypothetical protein KIPB_003656 [Kipferlia bialata]GIQ82808.1 hypothetical protein KIPB_004012 [Kipferlia bialata]|eukprot:g2076.t1
MFRSQDQLFFTLNTLTSVISSVAVAGSLLLHVQSSVARLAPKGAVVVGVLVPSLTPLTLPILSYGSLSHIYQRLVIFFDSTGGDIADDITSSLWLQSYRYILARRQLPYDSEALARDPAFSSLQHRLRTLTSSVISHTLYTEQESGASVQMTEWLAGHSLVTAVEGGHQEAISPQGRDCSEMTQTELEASADTSLQTAGGGVSHSFSSHSSTDLSEVSPSARLIVPDHVQETSSSTFTHTNNVRPLRLSWMLVIPIDPKRLTEIKCRVYLLQSWLNIYGAGNDLQVTQENSAFPGRIHPDDVPKVYAAIKSVRSASPVYKMDAGVGT